MNLYFDTEFESLTQDSKLISIGIVSENGKELYLEFNDIDVEKQNDWIKQNVLANTVYYGNIGIDTIIDKNCYYVGNKEEVKDRLVSFLNQFDEVQFVSDVCHYDFVKLINLFGSAFDLPENVSPCCYDINQDIARYYGISNKSAFDVGTEEMVTNEFHKVINGEKHNSLYDAKVIKEIYNSILGG